MTLIVVGYFLAQSQYLRYNLNNLEINKARVQNEYNIQSVISLSSHLILNKLSNTNDILIEYIRDGSGNVQYTQSTKVMQGSLENIGVEVANVIGVTENLDILGVSVEIKENKDLLDFNSNNELQLLLDGVDATIDPIYFMLHITTNYSVVDVELEVANLVVEPLNIANTVYQGTILAGYKIDAVDVNIVSINY